MTVLEANDTSHRTGKKVRSLTRLVESDADLLSAQLKELRLRAFPPSSAKELRKFTSGEAAKLIGVTDAYNTLQTFLGGLYVNDFNQFGHTWQVLLQAEPGFRQQPSDIGRYYVRTGQGDMVPMSTPSSKVGVADSRFSYQGCGTFALKRSSSASR